MTDTVATTPTSLHSYKKPLHEKIRLLGWLRGKMRSALFRILSKLSNTDDAKSMQAASLGNLLPRRVPALACGLEADTQPYPDLGVAKLQHAPAMRNDVIIITARFRTGSTLLWNLFRNIPGHTAYYEPFNERRWFDPAARGSHRDLTHRKVEDYWREYEGLAILGKYFQLRWNDHDLFMDADQWDPAMKRYVELLIEHAAGRPVLQFNRIDFRLPWFRRHFPCAKVIHLYRHPRDQWISTLVDAASCPKEITTRDFGPRDHYYLGCWARDLKYHFPFLDESQVEHPYQMFYYLWQLSYLFGRRYAHHSLAFEDLTDNTESSLRELFAVLKVADGDLEHLRGLVDKPKPGRWKNYADQDWFYRHEVLCDGVLRDFFGSTSDVNFSGHTAKSKVTAGAWAKACER